LGGLDDAETLLQTCKDLDFCGHVLFLPHDQNKQESVLILKKDVLLPNVHACFTNIKAETNKMGVLKVEQLKSILASSLGDVMKPELAIKYLIFAQFCTEVSADQLMLDNAQHISAAYYFFPNLVNASTSPDDLLPPRNAKYTPAYTWGLKCSSSHEFFTPRFLHTLFVRLTQFERNGKFRVWKNGLLLVHNNGTRSIIEVKNQTTHLLITMQCLEGHESLLIKQRSSIIKLTKSLMDKVCPRVKRSEYLVHPDDTSFPIENPRQIPFTDVAEAVVHGHPSISFDGHLLEHIKIKDLLHFEPFHAIDEHILLHLFNHSHSTDVVRSSLTSSPSMGRLRDTLKDCDVLKEDYMTYNQLYSELIQYSIFTDGKLLVSC
jgi:hypothetical protein